MENLTTENFREKIYSGTKKRAVLFTAQWCGFCRSMKLMCSKAQEDFSSVEFYIADIDKEPELKKAFAISVVPTFILFEDGKPLSKAAGLMKKSELYTLLGAEQKA